MNEPDPPDDPLPPLPTRVRFAARHRSVPRQNPRISLLLFAGALLIITIAGYRGIAVIGEFLTYMQHRPTPPRRPEPVTVEFR